MKQKFFSSQRSSVARGMALLLLFLTFFLQGKAQTQAGYVITYGSGSSTQYMTLNSNHTALAATSTFNPNTCIWKENNGVLSITIGEATYTLGYTRSGDGKKKNPYTYEWGIGKATGASMTISNSGITCTLAKVTQGGSVTNETYYLRYNGSTFEVSSTSSTNPATAHAVTKQEQEGSTVYSGGLTSVSAATPLSYTNSATGTLTATPRQKVVTENYTLYTISGSSTPHYWYNDTDHTTAPITTDTLPLQSYTWSISGAGVDYLTLAATTGTGTTNTITYGTACPNDGVAATIKVIAAYSEGDNIAKETTVSLNKYIADPTEILADDIRVAAEETETIHPTLVCAIADYPNIYSHITYASANTGIATVDADGVVTGVAGGTTTITIKAALQGGSFIKKDITVTVAPRAEAPNIRFDNVTGKLWMQTSTTGATIHYTTNGSLPDENSPIYDPSNQPTLVSAAPVRAIAVHPEMNPSRASRLDVEQVATPTLTVNNDAETVTFQCTTEGVTYHYTTDGTTPTLASTQSSSGTVSIPSGTQVKAIAVKEGMINSLAGGTTVIYTVKTPVITIDNDGNVTITCATEGATIHYTIDNSVPTASSAEYSASFTISNGQVVKAVAVKEAYNNSGVATKRYMILTGVYDGGTVVLNDLEDHTWTYYAGTEIGDYNTKSAYAGKLYSPSPRNVKVTYLGKGQMRSGDDNSDLIPVPDDMRVSVGLGNETENTFVYYKTLERNASASYEYTTIPNPFQVRPTCVSDNTTSWRGFQYWRIKSVQGGSIHSSATGGTALGVGSMLNAETAYYLVPADVEGTGYTLNCTSMEIELEAVWARAYVDDNNHPSVSVERNFKVIAQDSEDDLTPATVPTTYTTVYPNGCTTANGSTMATGARYYVGSEFSASSDTKFEYIKFYNYGNTINANCHNLVIGRGVESYTNGGLCANSIQGNAATSMDFTLRIESGKYGEFYALKNNDNTYITEDQRKISGTNKVRSILGCDYDRAKKDNAKLNVTGAMWMGQAVYFTTEANRTQGYYKCWIKSGDLQSSVTVNGSESNGGDQNFYIGTSGIHGTSKHIFPRYLYMEGGQIAGIAGGMDDTTVTSSTALRVYLKMTGGFVKGCIYGAGSYARAEGVRNYVIVGGEVGGWIAAGCNGIGSQTTEGSADGRCFGDSYVYLGGNVKVGYKGYTINGVAGGNIFGAGRGTPDKSYPVGTMNNSNIVIADSAKIEKNVYGGGNYGYTTGNASIYIAGGTVEGQVFGGSNMVNGYNPYIYMSDGLVKGGIYGGSNTQGIIYNDVAMQINGGQVGVDATQPGNIHGGGYGKATLVNGNVNLTLGASGAPRDTAGVTVWGDVYGGSALGQTNATGTIRNGALSNVNYNSGKSTNVTLNAGYINGSVYGGALGSDAIVSNVYGPVQVNVYGGSVNTTPQDGSGAVYGCNNISGAPQSTVKVDIYGTNSAPKEGEYALDAVYGGGNHANYAAGTPVVTVHNCSNSIEYVYGGGNAAHITNGSTDVTIYGGDKIGNVFGGGNGQVLAANISGDTEVKIYGGTIGDVYGGSNTRGTIGGEISVAIDKRAEPDTTGCPIYIDNVYGGGNQAASQSGEITIGCCDSIGNVFGGANKAKVSGNIVLNITQGHIDNVFGGNNNGGTIDGTITVNVADAGETGDACDMLVGNVFGGGNLASYVGSPEVNIKSGHLWGSVFGGGKGLSTDDSHETGKVTGSPKVTIGDNDEENTIVTIDGNVYGGGNAANVTGTPKVIVNECATVIGTKTTGTGNEKDGTVYGGGNAAHITGSGNGTDVTINGGTIYRVFGGGSGIVTPANIAGGTKLTLNGGTIGEVFGGSNSQGSIGDSSKIVLSAEESTCPLIATDLYAGGNEVPCKGGNLVINGCDSIENVYGGACSADVLGDITVTIHSGHIGNVFGGNNKGGNVQGSITVNIDSTSSCWNVNNVYGCGNMASYSVYGYDATGALKSSGDQAYDDPQVNIKKGKVNYNVFGAGKGDTAAVEGSYPGQVVGSPKVVMTGGSCGNVYGGGHAAPVVGSTSVTIDSKVKGDVFGGGLGATAVIKMNGTDEGNTSVLVKSNAKIGGNVFGGGNAGKVEGATNVQVGEDEE